MLVQLNLIPDIIIGLRYMWKLTVIHKWESEVEVFCDAKLKYRGQLWKMHAAQPGLATQMAWCHKFLPCFFPLSYLC